MDPQAILPFEALLHLRDRIYQILRIYNKHLTKRHILKLAFFLGTMVQVIASCSDKMQEKNHNR